MSVKLTRAGEVREQGNVERKMTEEKWGEWMKGVVLKKKKKNALH